MHKDLREILIPKDLIAQRVSELGRAITDDYADKVDAGDEVVAVCLLRGAVFFMTDLVREIDLPIEMDFMCVSSYGNGAKSSGEIKIEKDLSSDIEGKHVLVVEDIIDSGLTLSSLCTDLLSRKPKSVEVAALLRKEVEVQADVTCKYLGFECPNEFVVGYGLDYAQRFRNLPYIGVLKPEVYEEQR